MVDSAVFLQQLQGLGYKEHNRRRWGWVISTLPEIRFSILHEPLLGRLETEVHETTVVVDLWNGELHGYWTTIGLFMQRTFRRGSEIEIFKGLCR